MFVGKDFQILILIKLATLSRALSFGTSHVGKDFHIKVSHWSFWKLLTLCSSFSFIISYVGKVFQSLIVIKLLAMVSSSSTSLVGRDSQIKKQLWWFRLTHLYQLVRSRVFQAGEKWWDKIIRKLLFDGNHKRIRKMTKRFEDYHIRN